MKTVVKHTGVQYVLAVAASLLVFWYVLLKVTGIHASLGETNFQSNMIRADDYFYGADKSVALIGTSITGRLLPDYFQEQGVAVSNLGLDGCTTGTGIDVAMRKSHLPKTIFIEPGVPREPRQNDIEIMTAIDGFTFRLGRYLPFLRASARPSAILYTDLKKENDERASRRSPATAASAGENPPAAVGVLSPEEIKTGEGAEANFEKALTTLKERGVEVVLMRLPSSPDWRSEGIQPDLADKLAAKLSLKNLNVALIMKERNIPVFFSDGKHMQAPSAREAAKIICEWLADRR